MSLAQLRERYHLGEPSTALVRTSAALEPARPAPPRLGLTPTVTREQGVGDLHRELAGVRFALARLAKDYGKLTQSLTSLLAGDRGVGLWAGVRIKLNEALGRSERATELQLEAVKERGDALEVLVSQMAEVIAEQHQRAIQGRDRAGELQLEVVAEMRRLDGKLIQELRRGQLAAADLAVGEEEALRLEVELTQIDEALADCHGKLQRARGDGDLDQVTQLTRDLGEVLDIKQAVLACRLAAEGSVAEVRRQLLDHSEGARSATSTIAATRVSYLAVGTLIDAMGELEIKYRHVEADMVPLFRMQARIAGLGQEALAMHATLRDLCEISERLMQTNVKIVEEVAGRTYELLTSPVFDDQQATRAEQELVGYLDELNQRKREWAALRSGVADLGAGVEVKLLGR